MAFLNREKWADRVWHAYQVGLSELNCLKLIGYDATHFGNVFCLT
jgi:hypothetical protein